MLFVQHVTNLIGLLRRLTAHRLFRHTINLSSGVMIGQIGIIVSTPLLTRWCTSADFGQFAIVYMIVTLFGIIGLLQLEVDLPLCTEEELPIALLAQAGSGLAMLVLVLFGLALGASFSAVLADLPTSAWLLVAFSCLLQIAVLPAAYLHVRSAAFALYGRQRMNRLLGQAVGQLLLCGFGFGAVGLLGGLILGQLAALATGLRSLRPTLVRVRWSHLHEVPSYLRRKRHYPLYLVPANLLGSATQLLPPVLVAGIFSTEEAGLLHLVQRLFAVPIRLVSHNVSQVLLGELRNIYPDALLRLALRSLVVLGSLGLAIAGIVLLPGDTGWHVILGPGWDGFWRSLLYLAPLQIASFVTEAVRNLFLATDKRLLLFQSVSCFGMLGCFAIPLWMPVTFFPTIGIYALGATFVHVGFLVILLVRLRNAELDFDTLSSSSGDAGAARGRHRSLLRRTDRLEDDQSE